MQDIDILQFECFIFNSFLINSYHFLQHSIFTAACPRHRKLRAEKERKRAETAQNRSISAPPGLFPSVLHDPILLHISIQYHFTNAEKSERRNLLVFFHLHFLGYICTSNILPLLISADMLMYCSHTHHSHLFQMAALRVKMIFLLLFLNFECDRIRN